MPELSNRAAYDKWLRSGGKTVAAKAKEKVAEILANHKVSELDSGREEKIKAIIQRYEKGE